MNKGLASDEEIARISDLIALQITNTPPEQDFDDLVELAAMICGCPISLLTFVDNDTQWFKAKKGLEETHSSRDVSICSHAIQQNDVFVVENAADDKRFRNFPLVTGPVNVRFYAGMPITAPSGRKMGTLCVIDRRPKTLLPKHREALKILARQASRLLELRMLSKAYQTTTATQS